MFLFLLFLFLLNFFIFLSNFNNWLMRPQLLDRYMIFKGEHFYK